MYFLQIIILFVISIPASIIITYTTMPTPGNVTKVNAEVPTIANNKIINIPITNIPTPTAVPTRSPTRIPTQEEPDGQQESATNNDWGVAKQISEHTYTIKVDYDSSMANPQDILNALNSYRSQHGRGSLNWDQRLADYANGRAGIFKDIGNTDSHAGFENFLNNEDGFSKLGFNRLGENSYYGGPLTGTHLIEWVFAQSPQHNANQLDNWSSVGIGVVGGGINLNFGGN